MSCNTRSTFPSTSQAPSDASCYGRYKREAHDEYIEHDVQRHRVVLHAEKFLELVFRTPASWEEDTTCFNVLTSINGDGDFQNALNNFFMAVKGPTTQDGLHPVIISLYLVVLKLLDQYDPLPNILGRRFVEDLEHVSTGSNGVHDRAFSISDLVHVVEDKGTKIAMCHGDNDFRVLQNGADPWLIDQASAPNFGSAAASASSTKRKRPNDDVDGSISSDHNQSDATCSNRTEDSENFSAQQRMDLQCARYANNHLSNVILRSHRILTLFDRERFQLQYFDRSVIAVSSPVDLSTEPGQILLILMVYSLRHLSLEDLGLRNVVQDSWTLCTNYQSASKHTEENGAQDWRRLFYDRRMNVANEEYTLKEIVFRQLGIIGRSTCVVGAIRSSDGLRCVVKFSFPPRTRAAEMDHIQRARKCAESDVKHAWVLQHLPNMIASKDIVIDEDSVQARMRDFLHSAEYVDGKKYHYEDRCLRICVSEELHAMTSLTSPREVAQVFLDILQTHKWLYDVPKILHRDLSMSNIMFRKDEDGNVYGVPNDLDLAVLLSDENSSDTLLRRTGTPPFMAFDLEDPDHHHVRHLYRHDLESLFYVLVMFVCRYEYEDGRYVLRAKPPFDHWFDSTMSLAMLQCHKVAFFHETKVEFEPWVISLRRELGRAFRKRQDAQDSISSFSMDEELWAAVEAGYLKAPVEEVVEIDEETLGGSFTYWTFYKYMRWFDGQLLKVRCPRLGFPSV